MSIIVIAHTVCKEHCYCLSSKSSEETLTWTPVLYFQPHFALNVNLMHPWFHRNCKEDVLWDNTAPLLLLSSFASQACATLERVIRKMDSRWLVILALQVKEMITSPPCLKMFSLQHGQKLIHYLFTCAMFCLFLYTKGSTALSSFISSLCGTFLSLDLPAGFDIK